MIIVLGVHWAVSEVEFRQSRRGIIRLAAEDRGWGIGDWGKAERIVILDHCLLVGLHERIARSLYSRVDLIL